MPHADTMSPAEIGAALSQAGWVRIGGLPGVAEWAAAALADARAVLTAAEAADWRCGGTWFPGVDALPNDAAGAIAGVALPPALLDCLPHRPASWHRAQLSVLRPGYPQPWSGETDAAFGYRLRRDAAHLDGLLPVGPDRARMLREPHAFILGLPLTPADVGAAPLVVWSGSHHLVRAALGAVLGGRAPQDWPQTDLTQAYHAVRREIFARCPRLTLPAAPGEVLLVHRLMLHGSAPWAQGAAADPSGRIIAWFRPEFTDIADWLRRP